ncbi:MAG: hypothetical protein KC733_09325 [Candidatus Omnitrophica bacterium]|nr:hypothetical protein [Candidatus Omnitrophota bacterium]
MAKKRGYIFTLTVLLSLAVVSIGCEKKGTLEQLGSDADKSMKKASDALK